MYIEIVRYLENNKFIYYIYMFYNMYLHWLDLLLNTIRPLKPYVLELCSMS